MSNHSDTMKIETIANADAYMVSAGFDIAILPQQYPDSETPVLMQDAGDFAKWLRRTHPQINLFYNSPHPKMVLCAAEYWLPLVVLAKDISLSIYLNFVSSYIYDRFKGALRGDPANVQVEAVYTDTNNGIYKHFKYNGSVTGLEKVIKQIDVNKFME